MKNFLPLTICALCMTLSPTRADETRAALSPKLRPGDTFTYLVTYHNTKQNKTESAVVAPMAPTGGSVDVSLQLNVEVKEVRPDGPGQALHLLARVAHPTDQAPSSANAKTIEFMLHTGGQVSDLSGIEALSPEEQEAWQNWLAHFGVAATFPDKSLRSGEKWKTQEQISGALLAGLVWEKESEYVKNEACPIAAESVPAALQNKPSTTQEICAVFLTRAGMKQKSSPKDATPEDFKLHELKTTGSAKGTNEAITYISLKTGLVVRATEESSQSMDVVVAKADRSNRVHYNVNARSHSEVRLVSLALAQHP